MVLLNQIFEKASSPGIEVAPETNMILGRILFNIKMAILSEKTTNLE